jgi:type IX secretion system PorP/SprF family membrane protein
MQDTMISKSKNYLLELRVIILISLFVALSSNALKAQQEPMYSQYMLNMLQINPAYAGNRAVDNITNLYRKQWVGIVNSPLTATLSWDRRQEGTNVGYGLQIYNDQLGIESTSGIQGFYSYRLAFEKSSLTFGLSLGALYYNAALTKAHVIDGTDPLFQEDVSGVLPTAGFGALYSSDHWYVGLSAPALLRTKVLVDKQLSSNNAANHYFLTGGYIFNASSVLTLKPSIMLKAVKGAPLEYDFNMNAWINNVVGIGASYRTHDAVVGMFDIQITPVFRLGYAYDYTYSNLKAYSKGTHELMLRYEFGGSKIKQILSPRYY